MSPITCEEADALLAAAVLSGVAQPEIVRLEEHMSGCADCRALAGRHQEVASLLALSAEPVEPSPELRRRLMAAVHAEAAAEPRRRSRSLAARLFGWVPSGRVFTAAGMVGIAALAALLIWTMANGRQVTRYQNQPGLAQVQAVLSVDRSDQSSVLEVTGLPPPPTPGALYEVWLIPSSGPPQPAAYLQLQPDGTYTTAIKGDMSSYTTLATTLEQQRGNPGPKGSQVFSISLGSQ